MAAMLKQAIPTWVAEGGVGSGVTVAGWNQATKKELVTVEMDALSIDPGHLWAALQGEPRVSFPPDFRLGQDNRLGVTVIGSPTHE